MRPRAVQLATCGGFPHVTATHCPQLALPKVEWPGGPCGNVVVLGKPPLEEWPLRENPEGCRMPWARLAKMSLGLRCSMAFCSAKTLKGCHWANCAYMVFGVLQSRSPSKRTL